MLTRIEGHYSDGKSSQSKDAVLLLTDAGELRVQTVFDQKIQTVVQLDQVEVSSRLANVPRSFRFPDDSQFVTPHNDLVDSYLVPHHSNSSFLHALESNLGWVFGATIFTVVFIFLFVWKGIPAIAEVIAYQMPDEIVALSGEGSLDILDRVWLDPSELPEWRRRAVESTFAPYLEKGNVRRLEFRRGIGPNALALPDGTVVFTDELVELAEDDAELIAILFHEIGHLQHRHFLRRVVQNSAIAILVVLITGDIETADVVLGVPAIFLDAAYSRRFEEEADRYALAEMNNHGIDLAHFGAIMTLLEGGRGDCDDVETDTAEIESQDSAQDHTADCAGKSGDADESNALLNYLSTHPVTESRIRLIGEYSN